MIEKIVDVDTSFQIFVFVAGRSGKNGVAGQVECMVDCFFVDPVLQNADLGITTVAVMKIQIGRKGLLLFFYPKISGYGIGRKVGYIIHITVCDEKIGILQYFLVTELGISIYSSGFLTGDDFDTSHIQ